MNPKVTILMPVYNGEKYLKPAIDSILSQTYSDFEFIIINDGSTDETAKIILEYNDNRIIFINNQENIGYTPILNQGIKIAKGEYIARMDSDDISLPDRLKKQIEFLDKNQNIGICGTWYKTFGYEENEIKWSLTHNEIKINLLFQNVLGHPTVMFRKNLFKEYNLEYNTSYMPAEDYELWSRATEYFEFANIPEFLFLYRTHESNISQTKKNIRENNVTQIRKDLLKKINISPTEEELIIHNSLICNIFEASDVYVNDVEKWLLKLVEGNKINNIYDNKTFHEFLGKIWFEVVKLKLDTGLNCWKKYIGSELRKSIYNNKNTQKIFFRSLVNEFKKAIK